MMWIKKKDYEILKSKAEWCDRFLGNIKKNKVMYIEDSYATIPIEKYESINKALLKIKNIIRGLDDEN